MRATSRAAPASSARAADGVEHDRALAAVDDNPRAVGDLEAAPDLPATVMGIPSERATIAACAVAPPPDESDPRQLVAVLGHVGRPEVLGHEDERRAVAPDVYGRPAAMRAARRPSERTSSARAARSGSGSAA